MKKVILFSLIVLVYSCKKENTDPIKPEPALTYTIGQEYGGGIIFYIDSTGQHGLISAKTNLTEVSIWGCMGTLIGFANEAGVGYGSSNTEAIIGACGDVNCAARIVGNITIGGCGDWYLPSKEELNILYEQRMEVGGFDSSPYWSSTEFDKDYAYIQSFNHGSISSSPKNYGDTKVRCIRSF